MIKLIACPILSKTDLEAVSSVATQTGRLAFLQTYSDQIAEDLAAMTAGNSVAATRARVLCWMISTKRLEIRFAFPTHVRHPGIFHEKIGVFEFGNQGQVAFTGSANESDDGYVDNFESLDVFRSWMPHDADRVRRKVLQFEDAWHGLAPGLATVELSARILDRLIERAAPQREIDEIRSGKVVQNDVGALNGLWPHQKTAIRAFLHAKRGILEMATGTGKTRTALATMRVLFETKQIHCAVVSTDGNDLLRQWYQELIAFRAQLPGQVHVLRAFELHHEDEGFITDPDRRILIASRAKLPKILHNLTTEQLRSCLFVHDEVHGLGSAGNVHALTGAARPEYQLGLSATSDREYDEEGNAFIADFVGPVLVQYPLPDAIRDQILCPFDYIALDWVPSAEDGQRIQQVHKRRAALAAAGTPMSQTDLYIALAKVYKTSLEKLPLLELALEERPEILQRCIIFVDTVEYGTEVLKIVSRHCADYHTYFAADEVTTLQAFAKGGLSCLVTCHKISEGIDIRTVKAIILMSSNRTLLETTQRIGRTLRRDPAAADKRATVVDFIRQCNDEDFDGDARRRNWLAELSMIRPVDNPSELREGGK